MLYILGGAPRSGKTLLSKKLVAEKQIPYFPLDALIGTLTEGMPEVDITHKLPFVEKSEKLWKLSKSLFEFFIMNEEAYLIEGDAILPSQVKELIDEGKEIRACFLGYADLTAEQKLSLLRAHGKGKKDWTHDQSDQDLLPILERSVKFSQYLKAECENSGIRYFEVAGDFEDAQKQAYNFLLS